MDCLILGSREVGPVIEDTQNEFEDTCGNNEVGILAGDEVVSLESAFFCAS